MRSNLRTCGSAARRCCALAACLLVLAGCAAKRDAGVAATDPSSPGVAGKTAPNVTRSEPPAAARPHASTGDADRSAAKTAPPPDVDADPARLKGLDGPGLTALLGVPRFVRKDFQVQLWRYRHGACTLELYLYAQGRDGGDETAYRVEHVGSRADGGETVTTEQCLRALLIERAIAKSPG